MEAILLALSPFFVNGIAKGVRAAGASDFIKNHTNLFRVGLAVVSFLVLLAETAVFGTDLDMVSVQGAVSTGFVFLASQGAYLLSKKKKVQ